MRPILQVPQPPAAAEDEDLLSENYLGALACVLPKRDSTESFDASPPNPELLRELLARSPLLAKAAELLRNNSIDDMAKRHGLYQALLGLLKTVGQHHATRPVITGPMTLYPPDGQLLSYCLGLSSPASSADFRPHRTQQWEGQGPELRRDRVPGRHPLQDDRSVPRHPQPRCHPQYRVRDRGWSQDTRNLQGIHGLDGSSLLDCSGCRRG